MIDISQESLLSNSFLMWAVLHFIFSFLATKGTICFSCSLAHAENTYPVLTANILSRECPSRCCGVSRESGACTTRNIYWTGSEGNDMCPLLFWLIAFYIQVERNRNTFSNLSDSKSSQRPAIERYFYIHKCQSRRNPSEYIWKKIARLSHRKTATRWNLLFVFSLRSFKEIKVCA